MATVQKTLALFKPDIMQGGLTEAALERIDKEGFIVADWKVLQLDESTAKAFYAEHTGKSFFPELIKYMTSGPIRALVLSREDAIKKWRDVIGPTKCDVEGHPDTLRAMYGKGATVNGFHGSDSPESARREILFFFPNQRVDAGLSEAIAQDYLQKNVNPFLMKGLTLLCKEKPAEPVLFLANWLLENNPNKPKIVPPLVSTSTSTSSSEEKQPHHYKTKKDIVFVLGGPGSGKGTQCMRLADEFKLLHLSAGDLLRAEVAKGTEQGKAIDGMIKEGKLVPAEVTTTLLAQAIVASERNTVLVDGFPRALDQLAVFEKIMKPCKFAILFDCSEEEMVKRIMGRAQKAAAGQRRTDDNEETVRKRFHTFHEETEPVLGRLAETGRLIKINAEGDIDNVYKQVRQLFVK